MSTSATVRRRALLVSLLVPDVALAAQHFRFMTPTGFVSLKDGAAIPELGDREDEFRLGLDSQLTRLIRFPERLMAGVSLAEHGGDVPHPATGRCIAAAPSRATAELDQV